MFPARVEACLVNQRFQESDALWPDWRLALVHQAIPNYAKDLLWGYWSLIVSAFDQRFNQESFSSYAQMDTFLVKAANGDDYEAEFRRCWYRGAT